MKSRMRTAGLVLGCLLSGPANAQISGDTLQGSEVRSTRTLAMDSKSAFLPGGKTITIDSALLRQYRQQSMATLLAQVSSVFIRSYGFNSLATLSFRGASAAQSAVYWEGVPLMNGATGLADVSLLPVSFSDSVSIQYGSGGAMGGSGNIGGALLLGNRLPAFRNEFRAFGSLQSGYGSYGQWPLSAEGGLSTRRFSVRARAIMMQARNDFPALDEYGRSFRTDHASARGGAFLLEAAYKWNKRNQLSIHGWRQAYTREIPRALFESYSAKQQDDEALRMLLQWKHVGQKMQMYAKAAWLEDRYVYQDPAIGLRSEATTRHYFGEWGLQGRGGKATDWAIFVPVQHMQLKGREEAQTRIALAGAVKRRLLTDRLIIAANGRAERIDDQLIALPGLNVLFHCTEALSFRASGQRSYRAPSLHELYFAPGGNKDLKPEQGWSFEAGGTYGKDLARVRISHSLTAYHRHIRDWIIWLGGAIWTPHNLAAVRSMGLETEHSLARRERNFSWRLAGSAAWTSSTPMESYLTNDNSIGRQIPYTPVITGSLIATGTWKRLGLTYAQHYAGKRFITSDESAALAPYSTGNLMLSYGSRRAGPYISLQATIQNIWNSSYSVVAFRPMPGINYLISMAISFD